MAKKILFWVTPNLLNFGIANSLQQNNDFELHGEVETLVPYMVSSA